MATSFFCEPVLAFIKAFRLRGDQNALKHAALSRFSTLVLCSAKKALWEACAAELSELELPFTPRRSSEKRPQAAADLEDILLAFSKLDEVDKIPQIYCEATELVKLPPIAADPISELVMGNSLCLKELDVRISQLRVDLAGLHSLTAKVETSISSTPSSSYASVVRSAVSNSGCSSSLEGSRLDRGDNLMIFGLHEAESLPDLKKSVDELLVFITGRPVPVNDLFRLGRRPKSSDSETPSRPRPVLLKLMSSWDRRLIMSAVRKLKGFRLKGIFVREDLSPEERQRRRDGRRAPEAPTASNLADSLGSHHSVSFHLSAP